MSGSARRPTTWASSAIRARARAPMPCDASAPSSTFSATVKLSASMKCWCTMPIPARIASAGERNATSAPSTRITPSSGCCMP